MLLHKNGYEGFDDRDGVVNGVRIHEFFRIYYAALTLAGLDI